MSSLLSLTEANATQEHHHPGVEEDQEEVKEEEAAVQDLHSVATIHHSESEGSAAHLNRDVVAVESETVSKLWKAYSLFSTFVQNPLMNAAVTIFSLGIGVGLILGDHLRDRETATRVMDEDGRPHSETEPRQHGYAHENHLTSSREANLLPAQ
jgi:hypothetical protein